MTFQLGLQSFQSWFKKDIKLVKMNSLLKFDDCWEECLGNLISIEVVVNWSITVTDWNRKFSLGFAHKYNSSSRSSPFRHCTPPFYRGCLKVRREVYQVFHFNFYESYLLGFLHLIVTKYWTIKSAKSDIAIIEWP